MMAAVSLAGFVLVVSFASALFPFAPPEALILVACAAGHVRLEWAIIAVVAAALGQMSGKLVVFQLGRTSTRKTSSLSRRLRLERVLSHVSDNATRHPRQLASVVVASSLVGLPPLALVAPLVGTTAMPGRLFFAYGLAGRLGRFSLVAFAPFLFR
jgi:membrane protein YqaA with SNARE-associated domain